MAQQNVSPEDYVKRALESGTECDLDLARALVNPNVRCAVEVQELEKLLQRE